METLLDKSMRQTDEAIAMAQRFHNELVKVEAERDRLQVQLEETAKKARALLSEKQQLREINKELVEALQFLFWSRRRVESPAWLEAEKLCEAVLAKAEKTA